MIAEADESELSAAQEALRGYHEEALNRFDTIISAVQEDRAEMLSDRRFATIAGAMWEGDWEAQFANSIMVEVNKTAQGVEKIENDYRQNRLTVNFRGVGKGADEETAETLDGMYRADVYACKGGQAFDNGFSEGVHGGFGAWRLANVWEDKYDPENDCQRIAIETIVDADQSVFFDLNSKLYDKSDARFCFVITAMTPQAYKDEYGDDPDGWQPLPYKLYYDWFAPEVVRVAEYYEVQEKRVMLEVWRNRATDEERREWTVDLDAEAREDLQIQGWFLSRKRSATRRQVMKSVLSGGKVLRKPKRIAGTMIPVVPFYGKRWYIDNLERARGHVRLAKDPNRIYNAQIAKLTETAALAPLERPIFDPEQVAGLEDGWADMNINRAPYALARAMRDVDGNIVQNGPIGSISPPQLSPVLASLIQITASDIAELTNADDGADTVKANVSAEAMDMAATRIDEKSGLYIDNMKQSIQRTGEIWLDMRADVYFEEGREVETLSEQGEHGTAVLSEGVTDPKTKVYSIRNDLAKGKYKVISDVAEQTTTRRDKTVKTLVNGASLVASFDPSLARAMIITALSNMDGEDMGDLQEYVHKIGVTDGIIKPTPEEEAEIQQAAANQQPDPQAAYLLGQAKKAEAEADKAVADTAQSEAKTQLTVAQTDKTVSETKMGLMERVKTMLTPQKPEGPKAAESGSAA